jgi:hypothetical protein
LAAFVTSDDRAPELQGRAWLNTGGQEITLASLRGKIVLLDFWTYRCATAARAECAAWP